MTDIFYGLLKMSVEASWLIAVVILLRFLFRKIPRKLVCCLWALVALRLICPLTIESRLSLVPDMSPKSFVNIDNSTDGDIAVGVYKYEQSLHPLSTNEAEKGYFVMYASPDKKDIWYLDIPLGMKKDEVERIMAGINIEVLPQNEVRYYQADSELSCAEQLKLATDRIAFLTFFADDSDPQGYIYEYGKRGFDVYAEEMKLTRPDIYEKLKEPVSSLCTNCLCSPDCPSSQNAPNNTPLPFSGALW